MNNKISNPFLKQLISEIAVNANKGRLDLNWEVIEEAKKKKKVKEADEKKEKPAADAGGGLPPLGGADEKPKDAGKSKPEPSAKAPASKTSAEPKPSEDAPEKTGSAPDTGTGDANAEDADKVKADAAKAQAELEKAKAEKAQAEKEIKKNSYISLGSPSGTQFLLGKLLDNATKNNTIDALAGEMVNTLKIETPEDMTDFTAEIGTYMTIPGMPALISRMKTLATKSPTKTEEPAA